MFLVVAYDISSDKRRERLVKVLKEYGVRVNYSVFECDITKGTFIQLKSRVKETINSRRDSVLYYQICEGCRKKSYSEGVKKDGGIVQVISI